MKAEPTTTSSSTTDTAIVGCGDGRDRECAFRDA